MRKDTKSSLKKQSSKDKLCDLLASKLGIWKRHDRFITMVVLAIIQHLASSLMKLAPILPGKAKRESKYKQLQRFFKNFRFCPQKFAHFIVALIPDGKYKLTMDRTNRKLWKRPINILFIWVVYKWISFPLLRTMLCKEWNSNTDERIAIMKRYMRIFGKKHARLERLLADREFVGWRWFNWLKENKIDFIIRWKDNTLIKEKYARKYFANLPLNVVDAWEKPVCIRWVIVYVSGLRTVNWFVILFHSKPVENTNAFEVYKCRREIETLFWCLKTRWFNLEETHLRKKGRITTLLYVLAICFVRAHLVWERLVEIKEISIKNHKRKAQSIFSYWLRYLRSLIVNLRFKSRKFCCLIMLLSCT